MTYAPLTTIRKTIVATHDAKCVAVMHKYLFNDGTWGLKDIEGGELDLAEAIELAADLLKSAGGMLDRQASELRTQAAKERKRVAKVKAKAEGKDAAQ